MSLLAQPQSLIWTQAGGGAGRAGRTEGPTRLEIGVARRCVLPASLQAGVVFDARSRVFVGDLAGHLAAFEPSGDQLWRRELDGGILGAAALDSSRGRLYAGTLNGTVYALDAGDGQTIWRRSLPSSTDPRIVADLLFVIGREWLVVSSWGGRFHALAAASGQTEGEWDAGISPQAAPAASPGGEVFFLRVRPREGASLVLARPHGEEVILFTAGENPRGAYRTVALAAPVVDAERGMVFFITNEDRRAVLRAWSLGENRLRWSCQLEAVVAATPAVCRDGSTVVADLSGAVLGVSVEGAVRWRYPVGCEYVLAAPVCDGISQSYVADPAGCLHRIDPDGKGGVFFEAPRSLQARPSFDLDGNLAVPCTDGNVYFFRNLAGSG